MSKKSSPNIAILFFNLKHLVDVALNEYLPPTDKYPEVIHQAMKYSVLDGGKRLRPILALASCEAVGGDSRVAIPTACAIEFVHAFSLVHDDLPALDNDDLRRGKPTNHKVFGEAIAILTGDALLTLAFETILGQTKGVSAEVVVEVTRRVASATGVGGMITGQVVDILSEGKKIDAETLNFMHRNKTGALIAVSCVCGALLGGGTPAQIEALSLYGQKIGLAFQIADDILDIEGEEERIGKPVGSDLQKNKSTYPSIFGLERSKELARHAVDEAIEALSDFDDSADPLREIAQFIIEREA